METRQQLSLCNRGMSHSGPRTADNGQRTAFTLVELLVVITIIGILTALIITAAMMATRKARETDIKAELNQIDTAFMEYKNKTTAFPPNCQTDGTGTDAPLDEAGILNDVKRHMDQVANRRQEPPSLIARLAGLTETGAQLSGQQLAGGMSAAEAVVFWLGGFSSDPKFPISGEGGPSYRIDNLQSGVAANQADPIETRKWVFPFDVGRLGPRDSDGYFNGRFVEYNVTINGVAQTRRINFWQYYPKKSEQPYLYFDTSRHPAFDTTAGVQPGRFDPPAATDLAGSIALHVHAFKKVSESTGTNAPIQFVNPDKFQVLHAGLDDEWDEENFERMSAHGVQELGGNPADPNAYLLFPSGPFIGEIADTIVNFTTQTRIEDAQP